MTAAQLLAQAAEAEREASALWAKIDGARGGSDALIPAGCEHEVERASDLMRHARALRADAAESPQESASRPVTAAPISDSASTVGASAPPLPSTPAVEEPKDTVEAVALRIINSDSAAGRVLSSGPAAAADTVDSVARRIAES